MKAATVDILEVASLLGNLTRQPGEEPTELQVVPPVRRGNLVRAARIAFRFLEDNVDPYETIEDLREQNKALQESLARIEARTEALADAVASLGSGKPSLIA